MNKKKQAEITRRVLRGWFEAAADDDALVKQITNVVRARRRPSAPGPDAFSAAENPKSAKPVNSRNRLFSRYSEDAKSGEFQKPREPETEQETLERLMKELLPAEGDETSSPTRRRRK